MALFDNCSADHRADGERAEQPPASRYGLLLVDDETLNLTALAALLGEDYRVYTATHGNEALALLVDPAVGSGIQMVVSDQRMPGMTGVQLLTRIRALRPDIKALLLTGYDDVNAVVSAINDASVYRYMQKPVDIQELRLALLRASEAWQLEQDNKNLVAALSQSYEKLALLDEAKTSFLRYL
ncbi:MAG: response regulator, partial [Pseudomonadota bacterium]